MKNAYPPEAIPDRAKLRVITLEELVQAAQEQLGRMPPDMRTPEVFCAVVNYLLPRRWLGEHQTDMEFIIGKGAIETFLLVLTEFETGPEGDPAEVYPYPLHLIIECRQTGVADKPRLWIKENGIIRQYRKQHMDEILAAAIENQKTIWGEKNISLSHEEADKQ